MTARWLALLVLLAGCAAPDPSGSTAGGPGTAPPATTPVTAPPVMPPRVVPTGLDVPTIGVAEGELVPLHLGGAGQLLPPTDFARVGWYADGPTPGDPGPAVLAGHVDSHRGPAVFYRLRDLRPGDAVVVRRSDGTTVTFTVDEVRRYPKSAFPTDDVYGPTPGAALRLITCGGDFDRTTRSYVDNIVVYASRRWA
ncbi:class F sortase [Actinokineospora bangkokensis]|uniref:Class F sortase n=1 Tax=Actinokineospora bangkokensis TaxID=1193682 RepID=A0A1Q9LQA5_9PSEU|nr:class F sortase [Actinokineospora bangkokensis]OLR94205.1 class F sortase [Actinokineospora bangkokensis]